MDPDAVVALAVAVLTDSSSNEAASLRLEEPDPILTYSGHPKLYEHTVAILDALAGVCAQEKASVVAIGLKMGKPIELILAANEEYPSDTTAKRLAAVVSILKDLSDRKFCFGFPNVDIDLEDMAFQDLYDELFIEVYRYSYGRLEFKHEKIRSVFEKLYAQFLNSEENKGPQEDVVESYQLVLRGILLFRTHFIDFQESLAKCFQSEKVDLAQMERLKNRWRRVLTHAKESKRIPRHASVGPVR